MRAGVIMVIFAATAGAAYALSSYVPAASPDESAEITRPAECRDATLIRRLPELPEASGLAVSRADANLLWAHNDSSGAVLYALSKDGTLKGRVSLTGAQVDDWEAVTTASCPSGSCLYVGDIGDNNRSRPTITIYRMPEPAPADSAAPHIDSIQLTYPDGPQDAEALFATTDGALFIVTKGENGPVNVYRVPSEVNAAAPAKLQRVATLTADAAEKTSRVTDAAVSPNGRWVALRTGDKVLFYQTQALTTGQPDTPLQFDLRGLNEPQGEGIAWARDNTLYLAGEGPGGGTLARISCNLPSP
jgi:WD40 repeat protein